MKKEIYKERHKNVDLFKAWQSKYVLFVLIFFYIINSHSYTAPIKTNTFIVFVYYFSSISG